MYVSRFQAKAAEDRSKEFKNGGGGDKLKAKQKKLEEAEKKNKEIGGPDLMRPGMYDWIFWNCYDQSSW